MSLFALVFSLVTNLAFAHNADCFNPKNYVYDEEGKALFVKVYVDLQKTSFRDSRETSSAETEYHFLKMVTQVDCLGSFIAIPIRKKHNNKDGDDDIWVCPYCGTENPASQNTCLNKDCPLYRKKGRDWQKH